MARDIFGNKKITKENMYTKMRVTNADVRMEYFKGIIWLALGYLFFHFIVMGWTI
jgi:hypothetical protein